MSHLIVSRQDWTEARKAFLAEEKAFTRARDALVERRRALPWTAVDEDYVFDGPDGEVRLSQLFGEKSQLLIKHFMFRPDWEAGCIGCSFESDHIEAALPHLSQKDVAFAAVSLAPIEKLQAFARRMGWSFVWVSSGGNRFNYDYQVSASPEQEKAGRWTYNYEEIPTEDNEMSGVSVFVKDDAGRLFHTYSSFGRGFEEVLSTYAALDIMPNGREEAPGENLATWVKHHDRYNRSDAAPRPAANGCCGD